MTDQLPDLCSQLRALPAGYRLLGYAAAEHIERMQRISPSIRELVESAYRDGYGADLTDDRDLSARTLELMRQLSRPVHEREPPHCSSCACQPYGDVPDCQQPDFAHGLDYCEHCRAQGAGDAPGAGQ